MDTHSPSIRSLLDRSKVGDEPVRYTDDSDGYTAFSFGRVGVRPQLMLLFRKVTGETVGLPYMSLTKIATNDPERGFRVEFGDVAVTVAGQGLGKLFRYVCDHKAVEIVEATRSEAFTGSGPIVERIEWGSGRTG